MKLKYCLIILLLNVISFTAKPQHKKISVLFIGNSYTFVNNLPVILDSMAAAGGDTVFSGMNAIGGYTLQQHSVDATTVGLIHQRAWDYVVLQEQSQLPSFDPASVMSTTIPYALVLDSMIHANDSCTQTVFYMTWGRKYGDADNCQFYSPVCTYSGMQQRLKESYKLMADTCHGIVAPVGEAFRRSISIDSTLNLYQSDNSHPSVAGSYLAAAVFYKELLHKSPIGNNYLSGLPLNQARFLQGVADTVVYDSLNLWNLGINEPWAEFSWQEISSGLVQFTGNSNSTFSHYWNFGDTTNSSVPNPLHQYQHSHHGIVYHLVYDSCSVDSFQLTVNVTGPNAISEYSKGEFSIDPNPCSAFIDLRFPSMSDNSFQLMMQDISGRVLKEEKISVEQPARISVADLHDGIYFIRIMDSRGNFIFSKKVLVLK